MFWPVFIALAVMAIAYILYAILPSVIDFGGSFLWIVAFFLVIYIGAAFYLSRSLPAFGKAEEPSIEHDEIVEMTIPDRVSN